MENELTPNGNNLLASDNPDVIFLSVGEMTDFPDGLAALGGNDTVTGSSDSELIMGNRGEDSLNGGDGSDTLIAGKDNDTVEGGNGDDLVRGDRENDVVRGEEGNDILYGGKNNDRLFGDRGNDVLFGDRDNDTLTGGLGEDTLTGGEGSDVFVLEINAGIDEITDFENGIDLIQLPDSVDNISLQSSGDSQENTLIIDGLTGETIAQVNNISPSDFNSDNFIFGGNLHTETEADSQDFVDRVIELTNQERTQLGLSSLSADPLLNQAAQTHSENMALQDFFDHIGLDGSSAGDRIEATGYEFLAWAENIAAGQQTPEEVVEGWMNSDGHRANILAPDLEEIGVGYYFLQEDTGSINLNRYWTQVFGTPL
ncbi:CAP domain-containing protein [Okeania sp.]|uniref:CAP domain-containing protein n=1 Tax=Okeania sp. TaxID=3100323 RepID=UPI002B4B8B50|nr:CAP domain-containing protein [Okeania sp.]MEB3343107.1 CAP domain-containing protein [Okeania sp.]